MSHTSAISPQPASTVLARPVLTVRDLEISIRTSQGSFAVVSDMALSVAPGETVCIVGESGCGKSMTALSLLRLLPEAARVTGGSIVIDGADLLALDRRTVEDYRGEKIAMIFQEPLTALNPVLTVGEQIAEAVRQHRNLGRRAAFERAIEALRLVQMPDPERRARQYPHELSGGMRQRAMIALALSCRPRLLLADEPTTALDATVQIQILQLLHRLQRELGMAVLFVTHDVGVAVEISDRIAVMYAGRFVETGPLRAVIREPQHPYTQGLLASTVNGAMRGKRLEAIPGSPVNLAALPPGCAFAPRCRYAELACATPPPESWIEPTRMVRCIRAMAK